uniref:NADH dehydrogenase subunit 5 n=1 Tax=Tomicus yunnanensis TaxID=768153 RepID=UPI002551F89A|nr:NADH dehydrogenase subunit 5 [Tomicus yunnanensis]WGL40312.1 NADH dehydrogenase subunit 5 [Tomicus yunnanensis]
MCNVNFWLFLLFSILSNMVGVYMLYLDIKLYLEISFINLNTLDIVYVVYLDWISLLFMGFVLLISSMIFKYTGGYMGDDFNLKRFVMLVSLFVFSMMLMILSLNFITILLGWDMLGLVSYILVIYYQNVKSFNAGMLTALSNRVGDAALLMSIALSSTFSGWNFMFYIEIYKDNFMMKMLLLFIILAALTKSAQIPFSSWLPAAMAAPTPVSSLVHSSTLVTAGVYLLIRVFPAFSDIMCKSLLIISLITMFMAGICANFEYDLKKIIALSTLSQLGMMITILCVGGRDLAFFHLLIHALFKALLFMCAGAIIHNFSNCQDIRYMGSLISFMPFTCICLNISNFALCGLPFMSGFYSKDLMVEMFSLNITNIFIYLMFYISIGLTVSYSIRLSYYIFFGDSNFNSLNFISDNNNLIMLKSMLGLIFFVIFMGSLMSWMILLTPYFILLPFSMKILTLMVIFMGGWLGYLFNNILYFYNSKIFKFYSMSMFMGQMWNLPMISLYTISPMFLYLGKFYYKNGDQGWLEYYGSKGMFNILKNMIYSFQLLSYNHLKLLIFLNFFSLMILLLVI